MNITRHLWTAAAIPFLMATALVASNSKPGDLPAAVAEVIQEPEPARSTRPLNLTLSLVWTGRDLKPFNLEAVRRFRERYSTMPVTHLVSPAYFLRGDKEAARARQALLGAMRPGDHVGLRLGGWKSLADAAGVIHRKGPTFFGGSLGPCKRDCGETVPVHVYPRQDLRKMLETGRETLEEAGLGHATSLSVEGWVASPSVLEAAVQLDFENDFSAIPPRQIEGRFGHYPVYEWVKSLWGDLKPGASPFVIPTRAGAITQIPVSASPEFHSPKQIVETFSKLSDAHRQDASGNGTFHISFYQETAYKTLPALDATLQDIFQMAQSQGIALRPLPLPESEIESAPAAMAAPLPVSAERQKGPGSIAH